jgi:hypothetical protein
MDLANVTPPERSLSQEIVGYLNFSEGPPDAKFYRAVNEAFFRLNNGRELTHAAIARAPVPLPIGPDSPIGSVPKRFALPPKSRLPQH